MSITDDDGGNEGGSCRRVRSPLERLMIRTRPVYQVQVKSTERCIELPLVMAYAIHDVAPMVEPGRKTGSILTSAIAVAFTEFGGASVDSSG